MEARWSEGGRRGEEQQILTSMRILSSLSANLSPSSTIPPWRSTEPLE